MNFYVPKNLDVDALLSACPPINIKGFKKEKLLYIISKITTIPFHNNDLHKSDGYVPLNAGYLHKIVHNYKDYLCYLEENNIIESDNHFIVGEKSKWFRFKGQYNAPISPLQITNKETNNLQRKAKKDNINLWHKRYRFINKWYNRKLKIDDTLAFAYIDADKKRKENNPALRDKKLAEGKWLYVDPKDQYNNAAVGITMLKTHEYNLTMDKTSYRVHSPLTRLNKQLRNLITYDGKSLVNIDIKNSQPYLSILLFKQSFYNCDGSTYNYMNLPYEKRREIFASSSAQRLVNNNYNIIKYLLAIITLPQCNETTDGIDLQRYRTIVANGSFYKELRKDLSEATGMDLANKSDLKSIVFQVFFSNNRFIGQDDAKFKKAFSKLYPTVYEVFKLIKKNKSRKLPVLLQLLESDIMINRVLKRIHNEHPTIPAFTIHDSVVTTVGNEQYVIPIIQEEFTKAIGVPPKLDVETWSPTNLAFSDGLLYSDYIPQTSTQQSAA